ncbi:nicotinamide mononucleotide transporter, partial [Salmonella enterica]|nr:nicotinamide mononucleotide transporter [Salmonella enterica]
YGNAALNLLYYVPMQFYGMYLWHKNKPSNLPDVPTKILTKAQALLTLGVLAVATLGYGSFLATTADPFPMLDAFTAVGSVIAMWLMVKQYAEQWLIWIAINIGTVYIWLVTAQSTGASYAILAMWLVFLGNSIMGAYKGYFVRVNK